MPPRRLAIIGIDGTGKSTICRALFRHLADSPLRLRGFSSLQLFDDPDMPFGGLSRTFDVLSRYADELQHAPLKAVSLFLGMTLFGPAERFVTEQYAPDWIVTERHPIIDSVVYARFYLARLGTPLDPSLVPAIDARFEAEGLEPELTWQRVHTWVAALPAFDGQERGFFGLPLALEALFSLSASDRLHRLTRLFQTSLPEQALLLTLPIAEAEMRIEARQRQDGKPRDVHETQEALALLQGAYHQACEQLIRLHPAMRVAVHEAHDAPLEPLVQALMAEAPAMEVAP